MRQGLLLFIIEAPSGQFFKLRTLYNLMERENIYILYLNPLNLQKLKELIIYSASEGKETDLLIL